MPKASGPAWSAASSVCARLDRVEEALLFERSIDRPTYERKRDQRREQLTLAELELSDAIGEHLDVEGILAFAEYVLTDVSRLWIDLPLEQQQRLQAVLFSEGLRLDGERFGTAATCSAFDTGGQVDIRL